MTCIHHIPGRLRIRLPELKGRAALAKRIEATLRALPGIGLVQTNTVTGSLLVHYDATARSSGDLLKQIECLRPEHWRPVAASVPVSPPSPFADQIIDSAFGILIEKIVERSAIALLGALF